MTQLRVSGRFFSTIRDNKATVRQFLFIFVAAVAASIPAWAFHEQGVDNCGVCHTMHNSQNGSTVDPNNPAGNEWLLNSKAPSDICLSCHATSNGAVFGLDPLAPPPEKGGGNFVYLLENNINDAPDGTLNPINGDAAGHNINAPSRGLAADRTILTAPGGTFPSALLSCTSCHDPHGNVNFRHLYGTGPVQNATTTFAFPAPIATGIDLNTGSEGNSNHTAYNRGMSAWCSNCHTSFLGSHGGQFSHPTVNTFNTSIINQYNVYNGTADSLGGNAVTAYLAAIPFEDDANTISSTAGPTPSSRLMCLTCHRAHGSSAPYAGRWDINISLLVQDGVVSGSYAIPNPYSSPTQTGLCYKCHPSGSG